VFAFEALAPPRAVEGATTPHGPLARRWARGRLDDLLAAGRDRGAVVAHALGFGLVSPYTSLVAVGSDVVVSGGVKHSVAVPVSVPSGMQWPQVKQALDADTLDGNATTGTRGPVAAAPPPVAQPPVAPQSPPAPPSETAKPPTAPPPSPPSQAPAPARPPVASPAPRPGKHRPVLKPAPPTADEEKPARKARKADEGRSVADQATPDRDHDAVPDTEDAEPEAGDDADRGKDVRADAPKRVSTAAPSATVGDQLQDLPSAMSEEVVLSGSSSRALRLSAALGGGLAIDRGARGLLALHVRVERGYPLELGGEASLFLIDGAATQGRALLTFASARLARWFELGAGAGLQFGDGLGPAASLRLRIATPLAPLAGFLRYDAAVLFERPRTEAAHAVTLGVEVSY
jgi:hypothetical protein